MKTIKNWKVISALVLVAALASLGGIQVASAGSRNADADVIFTKWVTNEPASSPAKYNMAGVVSGDAGPGLFEGKVYSLDMTDPSAVKVNADYTINGLTHQFTANLNVVQDSPNHTGVLKGRVTSAGWMHGAKVTGDYQVIENCEIDNADGDFGNTAFQGTLHLQRDK